jgi:hypothetical protein
MKGNSDEALYAKISKWNIYKLDSEIRANNHKQGYLMRNKKMMEKVLREKKGQQPSSRKENGTYD